MPKLVGTLGLATTLFLAIGAGSYEPSPSPIEYQQDHNFWVYQVTEIDGHEYYGESKQYEDFPNVFFYDTNIRAGQEVAVGDWVVTVFDNDDVAEVVKINEKVEE